MLGGGAHSRLFSFKLLGLVCYTHKNTIIREVHLKSIREREHLKNYSNYSKMLHLYRYCTDFMSNSCCGVFKSIIFNIVSHNFLFPFSFQDITLVC